MKILKPVGIGLAAILGLAFVLAENGFALLGWSGVAWLFGDAVMDTVVNLLVWTIGLVGGIAMIAAIAAGAIERRRARKSIRP